VVSGVADPAASCHTLGRGWGKAGLQAEHQRTAVLFYLVEKVAIATWLISEMAQAARYCNILVCRVSVLPCPRVERPSEAFGYMTQSWRGGSPRGGTRDPS
jgi:hypothetical protein